MKFLSREQVLQANDLTFEDVLTPEWAPDSLDAAAKAEFGVRVRNLTGKGRGQFIAASVGMKAAQKLAAETGVAAPDSTAEIEVKLITMCAVGEDNVPLFTEADVKALGEKSGAPIGRIAAVAQRLSGLTEEAQKAATKA
jgi:hypothetical protein